MNDNNPMFHADQKYLNIVKDVLLNGNFKRNRTDVATISKFGVSYTLDNSKHFPLLTTKKMDGARWDSLVHELIWYLSGEHHIRNLREHTSIWDEWADEDGNLETAYGRFWRSYPVPGGPSRKEKEAWVNLSDDHVNTEGFDVSFDQLQYVIQKLKKSPNSRRIHMTAWHPANASKSLLPPCHHSVTFNVQNGNGLNLHLQQRSGDIALGAPFNIGSYALLQRLIANETGLKARKFHHSITDAHVYCGRGERADWWEENIDRFQETRPFESWETLWNQSEPPKEEKPYDHIPGLMEQYSRPAMKSPNVEIANKPIDDIEYDDIKLKNYDSHDSISFAVAP